MVKKFLTRSKQLLSDPQQSVLSAASIIMVAIAFAKVLGLFRQVILIHFFTTEEVSLFFAAFRLPDTVFEILVFGTFSSAFIPVFARTVQKSHKVAWEVASSVANIGLLVFAVLALIIAFFAEPLYGVFAPGYGPAEIKQIAQITRILLSAQIFFVISYVLTGVLESLKRFLVPALAPLFYNIGIIIGTVFLSESMGLLGPAVGVLIGALSHFLVQLPLALKLGFRLNPRIKITKEVKTIAKLAAPRIVEVAFLQVTKIVELFLSSLLSTASYAYFNLANSLQLLPVNLFGTSIAKAALPTLAGYSDNMVKFRKTLLSGLHQMVFLILPIATILIVLRIPIVRIVYGRDLFGWEDTVQTGMVLSAFSIGIVFQAAGALLARAFYALHDTKTPVVISIASMVFIVIFDFLFIYEFSLPVWGLAAAYSIGAILQAFVMLAILSKRIGGVGFSSFIPEAKATLSALISGIFMFLILKVFDMSVWIKRLSFLTDTDIARNIRFERFVLDTRYTVNLIFLTFFVSLVGFLIYITTSYLFKTQEMWIFVNHIKRLASRKRMHLPKDEKEPISPTTSDNL